MVQITARRNIDAYTQVNKYSGVTDASPHRLVQMLLEGALEKIARVSGMLKRGDTTKKGETIGQVIAIIGGLRSSLNKEAGGDMAENLDRLYDYMERQLLQANIHSDVSILDEVSSLLREIKAGWDAIPVEIRNMGIKNK
ncbi:MAG: flagellar export chaperone FliS [Gammaproteobacteria bacterium]|nr:flagellar export chaperone FliS [Gammaproteobacteria bacterium]